MLVVDEIAPSSTAGTTRRRFTWTKTADEVFAKAHRQKTSKTDR
jgi:hypothetical protein